MSEPHASEPVTDPVRAFRPAAPQPGAGCVDDDFSTYPEVDFGPLRVPVPPDAGVRMSVEDAQYADAVFFDFPNGSIRLSVLAAPRTGRLWPDRAEEIVGIQAGIGAQVSSVWGEWGRELHIVHEGEYNWVIGVDGVRSMLLGRATWVDESGWGLVDTMRTMIRHSRVQRGDEPMPVRTPLSLRRPGSAADQEATDDPAGYAAVVTMLTPPPPEADEASEVDEAAETPPPAWPSSTESPAVRLDPVGRVEPRGPGAGAPTRISTRRGALVAAAAVLVVAGSLWITREDPVAVQAAPPAAGMVLGGVVRPPDGVGPQLLGDGARVPSRVEPPAAPARPAPDAQVEPAPADSVPAAPVESVPAAPAESMPAAPARPGPVSPARPMPGGSARPPAVPDAGTLPTAPTPARTGSGAASAAAGGKRAIGRSESTAGGRAQRTTDSDRGRSRASGGSDSRGGSDARDESGSRDRSGLRDDSGRSDSSGRSGSSRPGAGLGRSRTTPPGGSEFGPADGFDGEAYPFGPGEPLEPVAGLAGGLLGATPGL